MRVLTAAQMKAAEDAAVAAGGSYEGLMENAGAAAAVQTMELAAQKGLAKSVLLLCGKGNNAGDAFVMGRLLAAQGWQVAYMLLCGQGFSPLAALNFGRLPKGAVLLASTAVPQSAVVVDGVFGTGFHGQLPAAVQAAFAQVNGAAHLRLALDVPSGLWCDTGEVAKNTFCAHYTFAFGACKPGLLLQPGAACAGQVRVLDIGL